MSDRTCTMPDCDNKHRARGYCVYHYNSIIATAAGKYHVKQPTPCYVCGTIVARRPNSHHRPTCSLACLQVLMQWNKPTPDWARMTMQRARNAGVTTIERVERLDVFERDNWTCYLCGQRVVLGASGFAPLSATVDHIVPLSRGGAHTLSNVATCCFMCNATKQASLTVTDG